MPEPNYSLVRGQVLVLAEEPALRSALRAGLESEFSVHTAADPGDAYAILCAEPVQVVLADRPLPAMAGSRYLVQAKDPYPDAVRLVGIGPRNVEAVLASMAGGHLSRYLPQPVAPMEVLDAVRWAYEQYRASVRNHCLLKDLRRNTSRLEGRVRALLEQLEEGLAELAASEALVRALLGTMRRPTVVCDASALIRAANPPFMELTRFDSAALVGSALRQICHPKESGLPFDGLWEFLQAGRVWRGPVRLRRGDGGYDTRDGRFAPVRDVPGDPLQVLAVFSPAA